MGAALSQRDLERQRAQDRDKQRRELIANLLLQRTQNLGATNVERERTSRQVKSDLIASGPAGGVGAAIARKEAAIESERERARAQFDIEALRSDTALAREEIKAQADRDLKEREFEQRIEEQQFNADLARDIEEMQASSRERLAQMRIDQAGAELDQMRMAVFKAQQDGYLSQEQADAALFTVNTKGLEMDDFLRQQGGLSDQQMLGLVNDVATQMTAFSDETPSDNDIRKEVQRRLGIVRDLRDVQNADEAALDQEEGLQVPEDTNVPTENRLGFLVQPEPPVSEERRQQLDARSTQLIEEFQKATPERQAEIQRELKRILEELER